MLYVNFSRALSGGGRKYLGQFVRHNSLASTTLILHPEHRSIMEGYEGEVIYAPSNVLLSILWQIVVLPLHIEKESVLLNADATCFYLGNKSVVMSRDMLSFEPGVLETYPFGFRKLRLILIKYIQLRNLLKADVAVFLTDYARRVIVGDRKKKGALTIIPHGIDSQKWFLNKRIDKIKSFIYVSNGARYKNHKKLLEAFRLYQEQNPESRLYLVGALSGECSKEIELFVKESFSGGIELTDFLDSRQMCEYYSKADCVLFSSECENMPNTMLEGMATGLPVLSSVRGPMTEVLGDNGVYYDPRSVSSIVNVLEEAGKMTSDQIECYTSYIQERVSMYNWNKSIKQIVEKCRELWIA